MKPSISLKPLKDLISAGLGNMPITILTIEQLYDLLLTIQDNPTPAPAPTNTPEFVKLKDLCNIVGFSDDSLRRHLFAGIKAGKIRVINKPKMAKLYNVADVKSYLFDSSNTEYLA